MPLNKDIKKVLVIGSGPIVIGQAAEFDYAGTQACRALREDGIEIVLVNSNPATIMTDKAMADKIYIEPLNLTTIKRIIEKEKPDSILSGFGGQTGLTLSMQLAKEGFLESHNVRLLGASPETIDKAEDRQMFKDTMEKIGQPCIPSKVVTTVEDAEAFALEIGYPVIIRPAFTLGGSGGGIVNNQEELREVAANGLALSPITQILVEKSIAGVEGNRVRGDARQQGQHHHRVLHGEPGPGGRAHRRLHRHRPHRHPLRQGVPDAPLRRAENHRRAGRGGRLQLPVRFASHLL